MCLRQTARGLHLSVRATPKASRDEVAGQRNGELVVKVTAAPDKGKANAAIVDLLSRTIGIPKSALQLVSGETARAKTFHVASHTEVVQVWVRGPKRD